MTRFYFPAIGIVPAFEQRQISAAGCVLHRRLWKTTVFDLATLAANHKVPFSWHLMEPFLAKANCELEVLGSSLEDAREKIRILQAMLYLEGASPFVLPFCTNYSVNQYTGINSRDSPTSFDKDMPDELRTGITSQSATVEVHLHDPTLQSYSVPERIAVRDNV